MPGDQPPPVSAEDLEYVADDELLLDDLGEVEVPPALKVKIVEETQTQLQREWPQADPKLIADAASEVARFRLHTMETGGLNYKEARDLGRSLVERLGKPSM